MTSYVLTPNTLVTYRQNHMLEKLERMDLNLFHLKWKLLSHGKLSKPFATYLLIHQNWSWLAELFGWQIKHSSYNLDFEEVKDIEIQYPCNPIFS